MNKLKEGIKPGYFLVISSWAGLSKKPGSRGMFVYPDGTYLLKDSYVDLASESQEEVVRTNEGKLTAEELEGVKSYAEENIKSNSSKMIFDAGWAVEFVKDGETIKVENDDQIYYKVSELLHFKEKSSSL